MGATKATIKQSIVFRKMVKCNNVNARERATEKKTASSVYSISMEWN